MRSSIARTIIVPFVLATIALVGTAYADPPHASCQTNAPHHTITLGPNVTTVSTTSTLSYWDNDCKCYIAQVDVPSNSSPSGTGYTNNFTITTQTLWVNGYTEAECKSVHERTYLYKKNGNGNYTLIASTESHGTWEYGQPPFSNPGTPAAHYCGTTGSSTGSFSSLTPPASGSDTYRMLRSSERSGKFHPVSVIAAHTPVPAVIH